MNKSQVTALLSRNDRAIELALLGLLARQTPGERTTGHTAELNGRGFDKDRAPFGTSLAKWVQSGRKLTARQRSAAIPLCSRYWRQVGQMPEVIALASPSPVSHKVSGEHEMCDLIAQLDRFQAMSA